jgi:hypothetical protein
MLEENENEMGYYVTCPICEHTEKDSLTCDCNQKLIQKELRTIRGKIIERIQVVERPYENTIVMSLFDYKNNKREIIELAVNHDYPVISKHDFYPVERRASSWLGVS